jgi:RNA polymerase sigma factor (TIGR02999 family)
MAVECPESVGDLMGRFRRGDSAAAGKLIELFYPQLKRIAVSRMKRESSNHTWQPTVLVNELYLELVKIRALRGADSGDDGERDAFLNLSAYLMRRLLIHHSRPLANRAIHQRIQDDVLSGDLGRESLQQIDSALDRLEKIDPNFRTVVELRVFEGLSGDEISARMNCSPRSVTRYWTFARNWLAHEFGAPAAS